MIDVIGVVIRMHWMADGIFLCHLALCASQHISGNHLPQFAECSLYMLWRGVLDLLATFTWFS